MTITIDFQPFANSGSANVVTQAQWLTALAGALDNGFVAGIAPSAYVNKAIRQSAMITAALANMAATGLNQSLLDDGNLTNLIKFITSALSSQSLLLADTGAANAYVVALPQALVNTQAPANGTTLRFAAAHTNTGASTLNAGSGVEPILNLNGIALSAGDIVVGDQVTVVWSVSGTAWIMAGLTRAQAAASVTVPTAASTATLNAGTDNTQFATALGLAGALGFTKEFVSTGNAITIGSATSIAHGLGAAPKWIALYLVNISTEGGYSVGDVFYGGGNLGAQNYQSTSVDVGIGFAGDATNLVLLVAGTEVNIRNKTTGATFGINQTKWTVTVRAWG